MINAELDKLELRRKQLLAELSEVDNTMRQLLPAPPHSLPNSRKFRCNCGADFDSFIDRMIHFDTFENDYHCDGGEIVNGKLLVRDTNTIGNPIIARRKPKPVLDEDSIA